MKTPIKYLLLVVGCMLITFNSCQKEVVEETPPNQEETLLPNSTLVNLMRNASANDGSRDNIIDGSDCFTVNLPVTIVANGITITIESIDDLSLIEAIFDQNNTDEDGVEFLFPITIILNDYTEVAIESLEELEAFIEACIANEAIIECVDFVYPVTFSIYNTSFQIIDTVIIDNDYEMYIFLEGLENGNQGAVLASLNFPVSLMYVNGDTVEVNNNQELQDAIEAAEQDCSIVACDFDLVGLETWLLECSINADTYNNSGNIIDENFLDFNQNGEVIVNGTPTVTEVGSWDLSEINSEYVLTIDGLVTFDLLNGEWSLSGCEGDMVVFTLGEGENTFTLKLEQDCTNTESPFNCFEDTTVTACDFDNDGFATFELETLVLGPVICTAYFTASFHISLTNAQANINAIAEPNTYTNISTPQTIYLRIEALNGDFQVFAIELIVEDCSNTCSEIDVNAYLQECIWNIVSFNGGTDFTSYNFSFDSNNDIVVIYNNTITIDATYTVSQTGSGTIIEFTNVAGSDIQAITGSWLVVECNESRLELEAINSSNTMIMEIDCSTCDNPGTLTNDLVIYMPFGGEVRDLISGEIVDGFTFLTEDRAGNATCAISFDGSTNFSIPVTTQNQIVQGDSFSISLWFKMQNTDVGDLELFFRKPGNATVGFNLGVYDLNTPLFFDNLNTSLWDNDWNQQVDVTWDNTDWHHLVVTVDSNNTVRLYRDGILRNIIENSNLSIGSDPASQYILGEGFQGHLDDLRVYKRALSPNDVGDLYNLEADCFTCL